MDWSTRYLTLGTELRQAEDMLTRNVGRKQPVCLASDTSKQSGNLPSDPKSHTCPWLLNRDFRSS